MIDDKELMKLVIAGSVDDGKSTLIGRLFYDLDEIYNDQLAALKKASDRQGNSELDLSLFTDGLSAEREQKITIDVAYRYFTTAKRRFVIADVPGHEQYTRNMVTGASNANAALILVDARKGLLPQSKKHLFIASLLGLKHIAVVINKMDLVNYNQAIFENIRRDFSDFAIKSNIADLQFIPVSSALGDMVVTRGWNMSWYQGPTLLSYLENLSVGSDRNLVDFRFPVQLVLRPNQDLRAYAGQIASGEIKVGETIMVLPSRKKTTIRTIIIDQQEQLSAFAGQAVALVLTDELDISRGDLIVRENNLAEIDNNLEAKICWLSEEPMQVGKSYLIKHTTKIVRGQITKLIYRFNVENLHREDAENLQLNEIGKVNLTTVQPLIFDDYQKNKTTGSFILIDEATKNTVGAGIILSGLGKFSQPALKIENKKPKGAVLWFTGLSGSGKSTVADKLYETLTAQGINCERLDGDAVRNNLCRDLSFSKDDRDKNIDRVAYIAGLLAKHGVVVLATFISPYKEHRQNARQQAANFVEIFVNPPLEICESRDVKGLYQKARAGEIGEFTGLTDIYEQPENPEIELPTHILSVDECAQKVMDYLFSNNLI